MRTLGFASPEQLRQVDHRAVIAWERIMREQDGAAPSTVRRRLAALSSLFKHLVRHGAAHRNPVADVTRPNINREEGSTLAFSKAQARKLLDAPPADTLAGLRNRAILSVGLQVGLRRAEIAALTVDDLHQNRGYDALRVVRKGGRREALAIHPQAAQRIRAYLDMAGHGGEHDGPLFRPMRGNAKAHDPAGRLDPDTIDRMVRKYAAGIGLPRTRCGRPSSPRRWRTARNWRTCRRRPGIVIRPQRSFMTVVGIIRRRRRVFLPTTELNRLTAPDCCP